MPAYCSHSRHRSASHPTMALPLAPLALPVCHCHRGRHTAYRRPGQPWSAAHSSGALLSRSGTIFAEKPPSHPLRPRPRRRHSHNSRRRRAKYSPALHPCTLSRRPCRQCIASPGHSALPMHLGERATLSLAIRRQATLSLSCARAWLDPESHHMRNEAEMLLSAARPSSPGHLLDTHTHACARVEPVGGCPTQVDAALHLPA